jgi:hypothetical protein
VADGVLDEVGDQPLQQGAVTGHRGSAQHPADPQAEPLHLAGGHLQGVGGGHGQVHRLAGPELALAAGQGEQALDQALAALVGLQHPPGHGPQLVGGGVRVGQGHVDLGAGDGQGGAQLVGGVGHEPALGLEGGVQAPQHLVEGVGQLLELVLRALEVQALVQGAALQPPGRGRDGGQGPQDPPGHQPAEPDRDQRHHRQGGPGLGGDLVEGGRLQLAPDPLEVGHVPDVHDQPVGAGGRPEEHHRPARRRDRLPRGRQRRLDLGVERQAEVGPDQGVVDGQEPGPGEQEQPAVDQGELEPDAGPGRPHGGPAPLRSR